MTASEKAAQACANNHPVIYENEIAKNNLTHSDAPRAGLYENHKIDDKNVVFWPRGYKIRDHVIDKKGELSKDIDKKILEKEQDIVNRKPKNNLYNENDE